MIDELVLKVGGRRLTGWTEIEVTRGIEQIPNTFRISATEASPVASDAVMVEEGAACTISLGADLVLTGYVDAVIPGYGAGGHAVTIQGRGKCEDLVDCSAEWPTCQISGSNALEIAQKLSRPYGITATNIGPAGPKIDQFNINLTETPGDILELVCRVAQLLYYEDPNGNLVLAQAGTAKAGSGFVEGGNVQAASAPRSVAGRYSDYLCSTVAVNTSPLLVNNDDLYVGKVADPNIKRHRKLVSVIEGVPGSPDLAKKRATWDMNRRAGRGRRVRLTADSWRDGKGKLWEPNTLAPVTLPRLKVREKGLCIAEVVYRLGLSGGRTADVLLMPKEAFLPEPIVLQPVLFGLDPPPAGQGAR
ncbi:MAG: hypothetical protein V4466_11955 [Pseudomonadota bacterium]